MGRDDAVGRLSGCGLRADPVEIPVEQIIDQARSRAVRDSIQLAGGRERRDEVVARVVAPPSRQLDEPVGERLAAGLGGQQLVGLRARHTGVVHDVGPVVRPLLEPTLVGDLDAEHPGDDAHRQRIGERGDDLDRSRPGGVEQLVGRRCDVGLGRGHAARSERLADQGPQVGVVRRIVEHEGRRVQITAARGVVLACGGFPHDIERRKQLFAHAPTGTEHFTPSPSSNTGDGLRLAESVGGWVDPTIPNAAAWVPTSVTVRKDGSQGVMPHFIDRAKPGVIAVNRDGRRFTNEGNSYHDFVQDLVADSQGQPDVFAWLLCDHRTLRRYGLGRVGPFPAPLGSHLRCGYLAKGRSLKDLAQVTGIDARTFAQTVERFNAMAKRGLDEDFQRGGSAFDRAAGDPEQQPNPNMAPLVKAPFYAIRIVPGNLSTFLGLDADENGAVLNVQGKAIPGLHALGADAEAVTGGSYPAAGITLGPAITFAWLAARAMAEDHTMQADATYTSSARTA